MGGVAATAGFWDWSAGAAIMDDRRARAGTNVFMRRG
jgi:hypothetical protein